MACKVCPRTGQRLCGEDGESRCFICGWCELAELKEAFKENE